MNNYYCKNCKNKFELKNETNNCPKCGSNEIEKISQNDIDKNELEETKYFFMIVLIYISRLLLKFIFDKINIEFPESIDLLLILTTPIIGTILSKKGKNKFKNSESMNILYIIGIIYSSISLSILMLIILVNTLD